MRKILIGLSLFLFVLFLSQSFAQEVTAEFSLSPCTSDRCDCEVQFCTLGQSVSKILGDYAIRRLKTIGIKTYSPIEKIDHIYVKFPEGYSKTKFVANKNIMPLIAPLTGVKEIELEFKNFSTDSYNGFHKYRVRFDPNFFSRSTLTFERINDSFDYVNSIVKFEAQGEFIQEYQRWLFKLEEIKRKYGNFFMGYEEAILQAGGIEDLFPETPEPRPEPEPSPLTGLPKIIDDKIGEYYKCFTDGECDKVTLFKKPAKCPEVMLKSKEDDYDNITKNYSNGVPPNLTRAIITVESDWDLEQQTGDSYGLMQVTKGNLDGTALPMLGLTDVFSKWKDPQTNIERGTKIFKDYMEKTIKEYNCSGKDDLLSNTGTANATWETACSVAAYNTGPADIKNDCQEIKWSSTSGAVDDTKIHDYTAAVLAWYRIFTENYDKSPSDEDYCKAGAVVGPVIVESKACEECSSIMQCLSCVDFKFLKQVFKE